MENLVYLSAFDAIIKKNYPDKEKRTIEDYLRTFADLPPPQKQTRKCSITAEKYLQKGNILYSIGNYEDAVLLYTHCLRVAPPYSKHAAVAYGNRSCALYDLKAYEECISDIDRALNLSYPDNLKVKLNSRKAAAVDNLNNGSNLSDNNMPTEDLKYAHGENSKMSGVSDGIYIAYSSQNGRQLVAKMPLTAGDVLIVQNPFLPVMELEEAPAYCHYCFKKSLSLIPCDQCSYEVYCSEKCRTAAYKNYHRIECNIQSTLMFAVPLNRQGLVCQLRCLNILTEQGTNLDAVYDDLKEIEEYSDSAKVGFTGDNFIGNTRKAFLRSLFGKETKHTSAALFEAGYLVILLRNYTNFFKTNADVSLVAKLLVKLNIAYSLNHYAIPYFGKTDIKAHVTYPLISLANHACISNTITYIDKDGRLILRALHNIQPGDKILCSYRVHLSLEETVTRSGRILQCKRHCKQCDKTFSYPHTKPQYVKIDARLRATLQKDPYDIEGLWKLLNIIRGKHQRYTLQAQVVKSMLVDAYEGRCDHGIGNIYFQVFRIM